ncbi:MAG: biotin/lipoyl-binding protein [Deltaproteobacteria bacterium]|nr:biotin/lipoyl-binding protein [Deltaproteobacteria bacterium]
MRRTFEAQVGERTVTVTVAEHDGGRYEVTLDGRERIADARPLGERAWSVVLDGAVHTLDLEGELPDLTVHFRDRSVPVKLVDARRKLLAEAGRPTGPKGGPTAIRAHMPGKVVKVLAAAGTRVSAGQGLLVVEAMKMENELRAPRDGTVVAVRAREGQAVEAGETLATLE